MTRAKSRRIARAKKAAVLKRSMALFYKYHQTAEELAAKVNALFIDNRPNKPTVN